MHKRAWLELKRGTRSSKRPSHLPKPTVSSRTHHVHQNPSHPPKYSMSTKALIAQHAYQSPQCPTKSTVSTKSHHVYQNPLPPLTSTMSTNPDERSGVLILLPSKSERKTVFHWVSYKDFVKACCNFPLPALGTVQRTRSLFCSPESSVGECI